MAECLKGAHSEYDSRRYCGQAQTLIAGRLYFHQDFVVLKQLFYPTHPNSPRYVLHFFVQAESFTFVEFNISASHLSAMSGAAPTQEEMPPSPRREERGRSRSPRRREDQDKPRRKDAGFKWKEKRRDDPDRRNREQDRGLRRGYKDHYRPRSRSPERQDRAVEKASAVDEPEKSDKKEKKEKKTAAAVPQEPMIIVNVNDRLGTKAAIPCLASDPVKLFKAMVAARIGREPHEILLKRQGERPFKDQLTLADYGVSNGVQLDL
jgi:hypothetical protein